MVQLKDRHLVAVGVSVIPRARLAGDRSKGRGLTKRDLLVLQVGAGHRTNNPVTETATEEIDATGCDGLLESYSYVRQWGKPEGGH